MFSPVKTITAGALAFAIGGVFLVAQPFDQRSEAPGAEVEPVAPRGSPEPSSTIPLHATTAPPE